MKYLSRIPNLSSANSTVIQGRVIWITKKDIHGKDTKTYGAYDYKTKVFLGVHVKGKEALIEFLSKQDLTLIDWSSYEEN